MLLYMSENEGLVWYYIALSVPQFQVSTLSHTLSLSLSLSLSPQLLLFFSFSKLT